MKLDRELQLRLLKRLAEAYPAITSTEPWISEGENVNANMHYLAEHGLIDGSFSNAIGGSREYIVAKITAQGMDFLADDGGLSAILGVVTVKLHEETIRQLLIQRVDASNIPAEERSSLAKAIRSLPAKALGTLTEKLLENGADRLLDGAPRLGTLIAQVVAQQFG